jgi:hypothetical protein
MRVGKSSTQRVADAAVVYGGTGLDATLVVVPSASLNAAANAYAGLKLELGRDLDAYLGAFAIPLA